MDLPSEYLKLYSTKQEDPDFELPIQLQYPKRVRTSKNLQYINLGCEKRVCILGVGKVGAEIAQRFLEQGYYVTGIDVLDESKINKNISNSSSYSHLKADFTDLRKLSQEFRNTSGFEHVFHTFIQEPSDVETFMDSLSIDTPYLGMMSTILTYQNQRNWKEYEISERKRKINLNSSENGKYSNKKREAEILFEKYCKIYKIKGFIARCNHIVGANMNDYFYDKEFKKKNYTEIGNGYPLGITPPHFRTLTKEVLQEPEIYLPNNGNNVIDFVDLLTLSEVITGVILSNVQEFYKTDFMELNIGNPVRITAKEYYILAAIEFGLIKSESELEEFKLKFRNLDDNAKLFRPEQLQPETMSRNWRLDLSKMLRITRKLGFDNSSEFWKSRMADGIRKSSMVDIETGQAIVDRMNGKY